MRWNLCVLGVSAPIGNWGGLPLAVIAVSIALNNAAHGLVLSTYNGPGTPSSVNTSAPANAADDPGWANAGALASGVYLGDQWVLTANHVNLQEIVLPGGTYPIVPNSGVVLSNPSFFDANGNGFPNGSGNNSESLDSQSDLKLLRIQTHPVTGLTPEQMDPNVQTITIASEAAQVGTDLTAISAGARRVIHPTNPNGRWRYDSSFSLTADLNSPHEGFVVQSASQPDVVREKAWGTNEIGSASTVPATVDNGLNGIVRADGINDVIGVFTRFDRGIDNDGNPLGDGGTADEFQGAAGDSGGPVFERDSSGDWVLRGVFHAIYALQNQSSSVPIFGQHTALSDLSQPHYFNQIAALRASDEYSVIGDIDLDGVVTGEIVNGVPTGDLSVLVNNWLNQETQPDVISWTRGDLNQDGLTSLADFVLLRDALGGTISVAEFSSLVGIPEPASVTLFCTTMAGLLATRRRRVA